MEHGNWDLKVHINGQHTFFLHQKAVCAFSGKLRRMVRAKQERKKRSQREFTTTLKFSDFPGGPAGFEMAARFCYGRGELAVSPAEAAVLHCSAAFLEMTGEGSLLARAEGLLEAALYWDWKDLIASLRSCEGFLGYAEASGLLARLVPPLLAKISANSDVSNGACTPPASSSSSASSPDTSGVRFSSSTRTPDSARHCLTREWWFDDVAGLHPAIIEHVMRTSNAYLECNRSLVLTRFLLHYLRSAAQRRGEPSDVGAYPALADTAVHGVVSAIMGGTAVFSCKMLFWVRRVVSGLGASAECRSKLEGLMGRVLDQASLDDLLVCGDGAVYDVGLVIRLVEVFREGRVSLQKMRKVGRLLDNYLREVSPDAALEAVRFAELAGMLPDDARDCFDGVYRALEIYLESHPKLSFEDRTSLCQCLNYEKLTLEACRDLAKNPWIPPREAVQALMSQQSKLSATSTLVSSMPSKASKITRNHNEQEEGGNGESTSPSNFSCGKDGHVLSMQKMQCKVMRGQHAKMTRNKILINTSSHLNNKEMPRLC